MPLYDYNCQCGEKFDKLMPIYLRHKAHCPTCGRLAILKISAWGRVIFTSFDTVVDCNGVVISKKQSTEQIPMLPEKVHGGRY